jgi:hypothetical protein
MDSEDAAVELRGVVLALLPLERRRPRGARVQRWGIRFTIGIIADTPEEVDELAGRVRQAGGRVTNPPVDGVRPRARQLLRRPRDTFSEIAWPGRGTRRHRRARGDP